MLKNISFFRRVYLSLSYPYIAVLTSCILLLSGAVSVSGTARAATRARSADDIILKELEFKKANVQDAVRTLSELTGINIIATSAAGEVPVTMFIRELSVTDIVDSLCRISGLWYRYNSETGIFIVMTTEEYQRDIVVFRYEPTRMFQLKYLNVGIAARTIEDLFGERVEMLGKANLYLGDDFEIGNISGSFDEDIDDAEMDEDDDNYSRNRTTDRNRSRDNRRSSTTLKKELEIKERSPSEIAQLEQMISEGVVGQIVTNAEAPIYVSINRLHNMLFVRTADEKAMEEIARIIKESDRQVPEVLLEMKVLEVQLTDQFESAFDISNITGTLRSGPDDGQVANPLDSSASTVGSNLLGLGNNGLMDGSTMVFQALSGSLRMRLQALQQNNNIKSLATPMLLAANNHPAQLFIGEETVLTTGFETETGSADTSNDNVVVNTIPVPVTEVREIGNTLTILPSINADRSVVMRIIHENSSVEVGGGTIPLLVGDTVDNVSIDTVNTSTLEGTVLAMDGMTVAVGGMMRTSYTDNENKVPILGDIPLLGFFFKNQRKTEIKTELVLLITPHILSTPEQGEEITRNRLNELSKYPKELSIFIDNEDKVKTDKDSIYQETTEQDSGQ